MKPSPYQYMPAKLSTPGICIELQSLKDFRRYVEAYAQKIVFVLQDEDADAGAEASRLSEWFAVALGGVVIKQSTGGYATIEEGETAGRAGFPDAGSYYAARDAGYASFADYELALHDGIRDKEELEQMRKSGFITGYDRYVAMRAEGTSLPDIGKIESPTALFRYAMANGFADFAAMEGALAKGFRSAALQGIAGERGFELYAEYEDAGRRGFLTYTDYNFAKEHHLRNREDAERFIDLEYVGGNNTDTPLEHDKRVALNLLSRLEQGKRISANKLFGLLSNAVKEYYYEDTAELPEWFSISLKEATHLTVWLQGSTEAHKYGQYDADGEFFEVNQIQDRSVVIDGSNVAYNSAGTRGPDQKPKLRHILQLVQYLKAKAFKEITVIADAALRHRLEDKELLPEIEELADYIEAPAEKPADLFIIQYVKARNCLLISNDTFREWKIQDSWVAGNIDYYRLTFMIKGEEVLMPDLK